MLRQPGFTLIELMVTIAIIAILAGVALPSYTQYVIRGKLQEGHSNLLAMRTKMEMYFQDNRSWDPAPPAPKPCTAGSGVTIPQLKYFDITCPATAVPATTYLIQADGKPGTDLAGLTLTIDQANVRRTVSVPASGGWTMPSTNCWITRKSGQC